MKKYLTMGVALLSAVTAAGCVSNSKYKAALAEADAAKTELEKTRTQKNALEQQVKTLKELNVKFSNEAQAARDELQRIEHARDKERSDIAARLKELEDKQKQLAAQNRSLRQEYDDVKRHNETLKSLVARYQKELKERQRTAPPTLSSTPIVPAPGSTPVPGAAAPGGASTPSAPPAPSQPSVAPMNINTASAGDMVLFLGLTKEMADRIVSNRPYRIKGELVAKNVLPKETFDMIKDRITVTP
ncbi:MAG TPA: helix-hairpin-helix domain-containing protein [Nitrospiraceae bacterium]|nr:helix-hairpin-helix domain-containing protein [Nitrospiraceae bacterium]